VARHVKDIKDIKMEMKQLSMVMQSKRIDGQSDIFCTVFQYYDVCLSCYVSSSSGLAEASQ